MLDVMRKHSRSFIIYVFFGIIIAVFIVNFGPQSAGCTAGTSHAARVEGQAISQTLFNFAMQTAGFRTEQLGEREMMQLRAIVMDQLLVRELLAEDALEQGFRISDKEIDDMIVKGRFLAIGQPHPMVRNDEGKFDYDLFSRYVRYSFGLNVLKFKEQQRRELLAEKMRQYIGSLVKVSEDEASADYLVRNSQAELSYVRFAPSDYRSRVTVDEARLKAWLEKNRKRVQQYFKDNRTAFQKLPRQVRLQLIELKVAEGGKAATRARAEAVLKRLKAGEPFAKVAAAESDDAESRSSGGLLGWRNEDSPGVDPAIGKALGGLKDGELSGIVEGKSAFYLVRVLGRRSGDLTEAQAEPEIAEDLYRGDAALELARQEAAGFIKRARAGEKLADMFTTDTEESKDEDSSGPASRPADKAAKEKAGPRSPLRLSTTPPFSRSGRYLVPGIGVSKEVMNAAFKLKKGEVADRPFVVGQMVYLVAVADRKEADAAEWARRKDEIMEEFAARKAARAVRDYARQRCETALKNKDIQVNPAALVTPGYVAEKKEALPKPAPCASLAERGE